MLSSAGDFVSTLTHGDEFLAELRQHRSLTTRCCI